MLPQGYTSHPNRNVATKNSYTVNDYTRKYQIKNSVQESKTKTRSRLNYRRIAISIIHKTLHLSYCNFLTKKNKKLQLNLFN